jgi:hypothetical protein
MKQMRPKILRDLFRQKMSENGRSWIQKGKGIQKRQLPEKVCERRKFFQKKTIAGKS